MQNSMNRLLGVAVLVMVVVQPALAQRVAGAAQKDYPSRIIRIVIPYGPGAGPDVVGRTLAEKIAPSLGQNIVFENRGGGGGIIGTQLVAKAAPDGYTLLLQTGNNYANYPLFYKKLPFDPAKDLIPVTLLVKTAGYVLVVNPSLPAKSVKELIALAKANPGKLNHGTSGFGIAAELFSYMANVNLTAVRYTGVPPILTDVMSGQIEMAFPGAPSAVPFIRTGRLRVLGISGEKRWHKLPDVPTISEAGVSGYKLIGWYGLWFPAGTPAEYISRIQAEVAKAVQDPTVKKRFDDQGLEGVSSTSQELLKMTEEEFAMNKKLLDSGRIVPQ